MSDLTGTHTDTERWPALRCQSDHVEVPGRTHYCRLTAGHPGINHKCICTLSWKPRVAA